LDKRREKYLQSRYKRELERYLNRVVNFVMQGDFDNEEYNSFIDRTQQKLESCKKVKLHKSYYERIEKFILMTVDLKQKELDVKDISSTILHEANLIRKEKRERKFTRKGYKNILDEEI